MTTNQRPTPILAAALGVMWALRWLTLRCYLRFFVPDLREHRDLPATERSDTAAIHRHAIAFDGYVLLWIALEATALFLTIYRPTAVALAVVQGLAISRIVDLIRTGLDTSLFDQVTGRDDDRLASAPRLVLLALISYVELMACFAVIYASHLPLLRIADGSASRAADAVYFSVLTQLTISFGSPTPAGWLRYVAALQGCLGVLLVALIIARMMSSLRPLQALDQETPRPPAPPGA